MNEATFEKSRAVRINVGRKGGTARRLEKGDAFFFFFDFMCVAFCLSAEREKHRRDFLTLSGTPLFKDRF